MANIFAITTLAEDIAADAAGKAKAIFTVTNTSNKPVRGIARARAMGNTEQNWLDIEGESERDFGAGKTEQFTIDFNSSSGPGGKFPFRLDVASATNPDEHFTEGPTVNVQTAAPQAQLVEKGKFPWWIIIVIAAVLALLIVGAVLFFVLRGGSGNSNANTTVNQANSVVKANKPKAKAAPTAAATATPAPSFEGTWVRQGEDQSQNVKNLKEVDIQPDGEAFTIVFITDKASESMGPYKGTVTSAGTMEAEGTAEGMMLKITLRLTGSDKLSAIIVPTVANPRPGQFVPPPLKQVFVREGSSQ